EVHGEDAAAPETGSVHRTGTAKLRTTSLHWDKANEPQDLGDGDPCAKLAISNTRHGDNLPSTFDLKHRTREEEPVLCLHRVAGPVPSANAAWTPLAGDRSSSGFSLGTNNYRLFTHCFSVPAGVHAVCVPSRDATPGGDAARCVAAPPGTGPGMLAV